MYNALTIEGWWWAVGYGPNSKCNGYVDDGGVGSTISGRWCLTVWLTSAWKQQRCVGEHSQLSNKATSIITPTCDRAFHARTAHSSPLAQCTRVQLSPTESLASHSATATHSLRIDESISVEASPSANVKTTSIIKTPNQIPPARRRFVLSRDKSLLIALIKLVLVYFMEILKSLLCQLHFLFFVFSMLLLF